MGIHDEDVAAVRAASDIVQIVTEYTPLRRVGRQWSGLCPFHTEKTPSFSVNPNENVFYCLAGETRVLTSDGVRPIADLAGTTARVLTERGRWVDAPFRSFGVQPLLRVTLGRNRQTKQIHATPEHRWLVRGKSGRYERTTEQLLPGHPLAWAFPRNRTRLLGDLSPYGIAHGIAYGDGTRFGGSVALDLHGDKDAQLLKWFPLSRTLALRRPKGSSYMKVLDLPRAFKTLPSLDEAPTYLAGWLAGYIAAAGHVTKDGTCSLNSADRRDLEFVRDLCTRLGVGTYGITTQIRRGFADREPSPLHRVHLIAEDLDERFFLIANHRERFLASDKSWTRRGWMVRSVEPTDRVEEVYCAEVAGTHNFTLEDNILTGNCFGCQAKGDVFDFVMQKEQVDFPTAVERLAGKTSITLRYTDRSEGEGRKRRAKLVDTMARAVAWYHERLLSGPDAGAARRYLRERGLDGTVVRDFQIGWAPDAWDELTKALRLDKDLAEGTGLARENRRGRLNDHFRSRILFPIYDDRGDPISFGGRILPGGEGPGNQGKYKNTTETPLYNKSKVLYGLDRSKTSIVTAGTAVICEGYTDVIGFHRAGVPLAVATCGTALTDDHVRLLTRFAAQRLVLAFDADGAGQAAAERFYRWEREHDLEVAVADLPPGQDPADVAGTDPERLAAAVEGATPFLRFRLDRAFAAADLASNEGRARAAERAIEIVAEHPTDLVRDQYVMDVSSRCRVEPDRLRKLLEEVRSRPRRTGEEPRGRRGARGTRGAQDSRQQRDAGTRPDEAPWPTDERGSRAVENRPDDELVEVAVAGGGPGIPDGGSAGRPRRQGGPPTPRRDGPALEVLRHAVHDPEAVGPWLDVALFDDPVHLAAFEALLDADTHADALATASPEVADLLAQLLVAEPTSEAFDAVRLLHMEVARRQISAVRMVGATDTDGTQALTDLSTLTRVMDGLRNTQTAAESADRLLAWLAERVGDGG